MVKKIVIGIIILTLIIILIPKKNSNISIINNDLSDQYHKEEYYGYLKIPRLNIDLGFYHYDNILNDVSYNIELIKIPVANSYLIAAHSGDGHLAYFNCLHNILVGDDIYLIIDDTLKHFQVNNIYRIKKNGKINISNKENMIYLTTCDQIIKGYQLIVEGILI